MRRLSCLPVVVCVCICGGIAYTIHGWTPPEVEFSLWASLPAKADRSQITAYLTKKHWKYDDTANISGQVDADWFIKEHGLDPSLVSLVITADVPNPMVDLLFDGEIHVYFFLDKEQRLIKYVVRTRIWCL
jgi:hypothetical protein